MGAYTKRIEIQRRTAVLDDSIGNEAETWETVLSAWASALCTTGKEYYEAAQVNAENDVTFRLRYSAAIHALHTAEVRVLYAGKTYNVKQITDYREQHRELVIRACEVNGEG